MSLMQEHIFSFCGYDINEEQKKISFRYQIVGERTYTFVDTLLFLNESPRFDTIPQELLKRLLDNLSLVLGISYWKIFCPRTIQIDSLTLSPQQASFWNTVYRKGLGEFFYRNTINPKNIIHFPSSHVDESPVISFPRKPRSLVLLGGGKDSIVSAQLFKEYEKPFAFCTVNGTKIQTSLARIFTIPVINVEHRLDEQVLRLNQQQGTYNGHIPISAIWAFVTIFTAALYDYRYVISSNEESANHGNVSIDGQIVNHQWSKSFEFEELFQRYVRQWITADVTYFSLLRPWKEIKVIKRFSQYKQYFPLFTSCNKNFRIHETQKTLWCCRCPKCAFLFLMLAPFISKEELHAIFPRNLFVDTSLIPLYEELLGIKGIKPFECVATPEEVKYALFLVSQREEFADEPVVHFLVEKFKDSFSDVEKSGPALFVNTKHLIPEAFRSMV